MNEEKFSKIISFDSQINEAGEIELPRGKLLSLLQKGYKEIKVYVYGDSRKTAADLGYDSKLFDRIKEVQSLPDSVVFDFLKAKGSMYNAGLEKRILR